MIFNIHGLGFEVNSHNDKFLEYLKYRFQKFSSGECKIDIKFYVKFGKSYPSFSSYERISQDFYLNKNKFVIKKENVIIFYNLDTKPIEAIIYFHPKKPKHFAKLIIKGKKNTFRDYYEHSIIWRGIQNTLLALLEQRGLLVLHASTIKGDKGATLFFGLAGVGKTTIALDFVFHKKFKMMGDNFILIDGKNAYPFLEPITITNFKRKKLGFKVIKKLLEKNKIFNSYFLKDKYSHNSPCKIKNIVILSASQNNSFYKIKDSESLSLIKNSMKILGETPEFTELNMVFKKKKLEISSKIKFYRLSYKSLDSAKRLLAGFL